MNSLMRIALCGGPAKKRVCAGWTVKTGKEFVMDGGLLHGPKAWKHFFALTFFGYFFVSRQKSDKQDMGWTVVPGSANSSKQQMTIPQVTVKEAGYIFVYLSYEDESNNYVYFDDFKVTHTPSRKLP